MKKITLFSLLLIGFHSFAQIVNTAPYILTVGELKQWTQNGPTASPDLISTVMLAPRFTNSATQFNPTLSNDMKIAYLPDGMNNFGNYFGEQTQFNLYNFTHWAYIDKLVWFGGTSSQTIQIPSSPWANAAHKNGVKIFGNVFFAPTAFGGSTTTLTNFLEQDLDGNFVAIPKLVDIMQYYNFDGWFLNQETATNSATAALMYEFVRDLTTQVEAVGKEVMWYDAMLLSGSVGWQNRLNVSNSVFVQRDEDVDISNGFETRVSSNIFINFFWSSNVLPNASRSRATTIGRSQFDVFTGADIWPGRNQGDFETGGNTFMTNLHENATTPFTSLGLFAPNCVYNSAVYTNFNNDPTDYATFYNAENHLFSGDDNNPSSVDATGFKGLCNWIPEASVISNAGPNYIASDLFYTDFCTGHGTKKFENGALVSSDSWHDMNKQSILPTWQFAFSENNTLSAEWDFNDAVSNGNSLKISGNLPANHAVDLMLYKTNLDLTGWIDPAVFNAALVYKTPNADNHMKLVVVFADEPNQKYAFRLVDNDTELSNGWIWNAVDMSEGGSPLFYSRNIAMIGLRFESEAAIADYTVNIGSFGIDYIVLLGTKQSNANNNFVTVSYPVESKDNLSLTINWPNTKQICYTVYDLQGQAVKSNSIKLNGITTYSLNTNAMASGTYTVKFTSDKNVTENQKIIIR